MSALTASQLVIAEMLAINNQQQAAEILRLKAENRVLENQVAYFVAALRASEESHENLTRRFLEEVTA